MVEPLFALVVLVLVLITMRALPGPIVAVDSGGISATVGLVVTLSSRVQVPVGRLDKLRRLPDWVHVQLKRESKLGWNFPPRTSATRESTISRVTTSSLTHSW